MRGFWLGAVAAACVATPALARERAPQPAPDLAQIADSLSNPVVQDTVAAVVDQFAAVLLDTRVGPLARYAAPGERIRPDDTLASVLARRDPQYAQKLHEQTHDLVRGAGQAAGDAAAMRAELKRTSERLRRMLDTLAIPDAGQ